MCIHSFTICIDVLWRHMWYGTGMSGREVAQLFKQFLWLSFIKKTRFFTQPRLHQHENKTGEIKKKNWIIFILQERGCTTWWWRFPAGPMPRLRLTWRRTSTLSSRTSRRANSGKQQSWALFLSNKPASSVRQRRRVSRSTATVQ